MPEVRDIDRNHPGNSSQRGPRPDTQPPTHGVQRYKYIVTHPADGCRTPPENAGFHGLQSSLQSERLRPKPPDLCLDPAGFDLRVHRHRLNIKLRMPGGQLRHRLHFRLKQAEKCGAESRVPTEDRPGKRHGSSLVMTHDCVTACMPSGDAPAVYAVADGLLRHVHLAPAVQRGSQEQHVIRVGSEQPSAVSRKQFGKRKALQVATTKR